MKAPVHNVPEGDPSADRFRRRVPGLVLLAALCWSGPAVADFEDGKRAALRGDYIAAYREWQPLADAGHADAQFLLGLMYKEGRGVERDFTASAAWLERAARQYHVDAQFFLGRALRDGQGTERDAARAVTLFRAAADKDHARAAFELGHLYRKGDGVAADDSEAGKWYLRAAGLGHAEARFTMGSLYDEGRGVAKNWTEAYAWYALAGESGVELGGLLRDRIGRRLTATELAAAEARLADIKAGRKPPAAPSVPLAGASSAPTPTSTVASAPTREQPASAEPPPKRELAPLPPSKPAPAAARTGKYLVRLAAYRLPDEPGEGWRILERRHPALLAGHSPITRKVDLGGDKGVFYRLFAGPFADRTGASKFCDALKERGDDCVVTQDE